MPNQGGRYVMRNGKRELVTRTKEAPDTKPAKAQPVKAKPAAKPATDKTAVTEDADNG